MKASEMRELRHRFEQQHGVMSRAELRGLGVDRGVEQRKVLAGEWERLGKRVIRVAGAPLTPHHLLMGACLEAGSTAVASHESAAWLWGFGPLPKRHTVTIGRSARAAVSWAVVHRSRDLPALAPVRAGIRCTNPLRTLVDLAATADQQSLESALDSAIASGLVTAQGVASEADRLSRQGRRGVGRIRQMLRRRGFLTAPHPSVLESKLLRLLKQHGIRPLGVEVRVWNEGRYRVDVAVSEDVLVETDGYAYHHTPEQKTEDERRRNRIRLTGKFVLVYTWRDVIHDGARVIAEIREAERQAWTRRGDGRRNRRSTAGYSLGQASITPVR
ncbi:MAG TPA: hypothetical protein VMO88_15810 [Acidimicrobiales bacterium]|nr:hypothetical protein [Acidimicrobiales bacterium]